MIESLLVPTYSEIDSTSPSTPPLSISPTASPASPPSRSFSHTWRDNCICERPTDWLIATQEFLGGGKTRVRDGSGLRELASHLNVGQKAEYRRVTEN